jgi:hypothetical protein
VKYNKILAILSILTSNVLPVSGQAILLEIGSQKQLLVDDYVIDKKQNITRELGKPTKIGVVMGPTIPTDFDPVKEFPDGLPKTGGYYEFGRRLSVVWNEKRELFQMLYRASAENLTAYAESIDGIHWTKPLVSGDAKSNLITYRGKNRGTFYEASFMIDPTVPWGHPEKYKAAYNPGNTQCAIAYSKDGIHWKGYNNGESVTGRAADTYNQILWDPVAQRYLLLTRTDIGDMGGFKESRSTRIMVHEKGNDLLAYPTAWKTLANINVDDPDGKITKAGVPERQVESMVVWVYENVYFGLMHVLTAGELTGFEGRREIADPQKRPEVDVIDYYIGTSRNGKDYDKSWLYTRKPFINRGPDGGFDKAMLQPSSEIITRNDEHLIFYTGQYNQHHTPENVQKESGKIGLAKLPLDRFICQSAGDKVGTIVSKPFKLQGDMLEINVDGRGGRFFVEILDAAGEPIPGFTAEQANVYHASDELRLKPQWNSNKDLSSLKGRIIRLKFYLSNAKLYAFQITS